MVEIYSRIRRLLNLFFPNTYKYLERYKVVFKFIIAGGTATVVDLVLLYIFTDIFGLWYILSASLAFMVAFFISFFLQKFWTFRDNDRKKIYQQMSLYFIVCLTNLFINAGGLYLLVDRFNIYYIFAQIIMGALIATSSFVIYRLIIFKKHRKEECAK